MACPTIVFSSFKKVEKTSALQKTVRFFIHLIGGIDFNKMRLPNKKFSPRLSYLQSRSLFYFTAAQITACARSRTFRNHLAEFAPEEAEAIVSHIRHIKSLRKHRHTSAMLKYFQSIGEQFTCAQLQSNP